MPAANDFASIHAAVVRLKFERYGCKVRVGLPVADCWCYRAGPDGTSIPCPAPTPSAEAKTDDYCCG